MKKNNTFFLVLSCLLLLAALNVHTAKAEAFAFENATYQVLVKKSIELKPVAQDIEGKLDYEWESSDKEIATVSQGTVKGVAVGSATIVCTATNKDGQTYTAECKVEVLQPVTKITADETKLELPSDIYFLPEVKIEPENASNKEIEWTSSNEKVVHVFPKGKAVTRSAGKATLTGTACDGSGKKVTITVTVPKVYVTSKNITIDSPEGVEFGSQINMSGIFSTSIKGDAFNTESMDSDKDGLDWMRLMPSKAGSGSIVFRGNGSTLATVKVKVEHSAVYDEVSCPKTTVEALLEKGEAAIGEKVGLTGEVAEFKPDKNTGNAGKLYLKAKDGYFCFWYGTAGLTTIGEKFTIYGPITGFETYETETGLTYECPVIELKSAE